MIIVRIIIQQVDNHKQDATYVHTHKEAFERIRWSCMRGIAYQLKWRGVDERIEHRERIVELLGLIRADNKVEKWLQQ